MEYTETLILDRRRLVSSLPDERKREKNMSFIIRSTLHQAVRRVNLTLSRSFVRPSHGSATYDKGYATVRFF